jgi:hypothetical protein
MLLTGARTGSVSLHVKLSLRKHCIKRENPMLEATDVFSVIEKLNSFKPEQI